MATVQDTTTGRLLNRELSRLDFNARVLDLACDPAVPLLERVKFCAIFSSNLDEFFMVRVAGLMGQARRGLTVRSADGLTPRQALAAIRERVVELTPSQSKLWRDELRPALAAEGIVHRARRRLRPTTSCEELAGALRARALPGADAARGRSRPAVPVHLRPLAVLACSSATRRPARSASRA